MNLVSIGIIAGVILVALFVLGFILTRLYRRASKEVSPAHIGFSGEKIIMNGGAMALPVLHEIIPVNMNTLRLEVCRAARQALITRDRIRVDAMAEFYVRVKPSVESIATTAQTLGMKTMSSDESKDLAEGKSVDVLCTVAAGMAIEELHEKRVGFVQKVQQVASEDLFKNGLELETVSLTGLDQTSFEFFNPQNASDVEDLTKLTETIEGRRKECNEIEQDTDLVIKTKDLEVERRRLKISCEEEYVKPEQEREIAVHRVGQEASIAEQEARKKREAEGAKIAAEREVGLKCIAAERNIKNEDIRKAQAIEQVEVERRKATELAEQDRAITAAERSRAESEARAEIDKARAAAVYEGESVITVREVEHVECVKAVELIAARGAAQEDAISLTVAAEAEKQATQDRAEAVRIVAEAEAEKQRLQAKGETDAKVLLVQAREQQYKVDAEDTRAMSEAANVLSIEQVEMQVRLAPLRHLPDIIRKSVCPMENIDDIKILQVNGLGGFSGVANGSKDVLDGQTTQASLADQIVNGALRYRSRTLLVDDLLKELDLNGGDINGSTQGLDKGIGKNAAE